VREFVGKVTKRPFASGSKSEREAVRLDTDNGSFVLRREGGNPLYDPMLEELVGKTIKCTGETHDYTLTMTDWSEHLDR
jgi:hypothetical protein